MKNLVTRALTGIVFVALLLSALCLHGYLFMALFTLIATLTAWEFYGITERGEERAAKRLLLSLGGGYLFAATYLWANGLVGGPLLFLPYLLLLMYALISALYERQEDPIRAMALAFFGQAYCVAPFALLNLVPPYLALALFIFVWTNDTGAYLAGSLLGRHKLFERISPKKTWEGSIGGWVLTLVAAGCFWRLAPEAHATLSLAYWLGLATTITLFGTWGDLVESLLKRTLGIKDSGHILPGHGGMLDRFDSVLMAIPATYIYIYMFIAG